MGGSRQLLQRGDHGRAKRAYQKGGPMKGAKIITIAEKGGHLSASLHLKGRQNSVLGELGWPPKGGKKKKENAVP